MKKINLLVIALLTIGFAACSMQSSIKPGSIVKVKYKGTLADGTVFDSTENKAPLSFLVGAKQVIPEFEKQVTSLKAGQTKSFKIKAADAYGEAKPENIQELERDERFKNVDLKEGVVIFVNRKNNKGETMQIPVKVVKLTEDKVTLDGNHPLAGQDLNFEVTLVEVKEAQAPETAKTTEAQS